MMGELATTKGKEHALAQLAWRRENKPEPINNAKLYAGSPMYYYCKSCGHLAAELSESHLFPAPPLCKECQALKDCGWLE